MTRFRIIALGFSLVVLLCAGWLGCELRRTYVARPLTAVDYRAQIRRLGEEEAQVADRDQADAQWARLRNLLDRTVDTVISFRDEPSSPSRANPRLVTDREAEAALLALGSAGIFEELAELARSGPALPPVVESDLMLLGEPFRGLAEIRSLGLARLASMRQALARGDRADYVAGFGEVMWLGRTAALQASMIPARAGTNIAAMACDELRRGLRETTFTTDDYVALLATFRTRPLPPPALGLAGERLIYHDFLQLNYSDDGHGDGYMLAVTAANIEIISGPPREPNIMAAALARFRLADRQRTREVLDETVDRCLRMTTTSHAESQADAIAALVAKPLPGLVADDLERRTRIRGTQVMAALGLHRARHGRYPRSLGELSAAIGAVPGEIFEYRVLEDGAAYALSCAGTVLHPLNPARPGT